MFGNELSITKEFVSFCHRFFTELQIWTFEFPHSRFWYDLLTRRIRSILFGSLLQNLSRSGIGLWSYLEFGNKKGKTFCLVICLLKRILLVYAWNKHIWIGKVPLRIKACNLVIITCHFHNLNVEYEKFLTCLYFDVQFLRMDVYYNVMIKFDTNKFDSWTL